MKKNLICIVSFIVILFISIGSFMFFQSRSKSEEYNKIDNNNINEKEINSSDEISDVNETFLIVEGNISKQETIKENNTVIQDNNINSSVDEKKNNNSSNQEKESNNKKEDSNTNLESKPEEKVEEIKKEPTAWEELGISESDYYNKPMWSWARIDFSIDKYKTYEKTREACITKGEEYYEQGYGYSCTGINSYSGKYLGEMLKTF